MSDFLFRGSLADLDPEVYELTQIESERQARKLILIPSESQAPLAVREAMSSAFQNIYAEGYPKKTDQRLAQKDLLNYPERLADFRRYSDPRYYKGTEYADIVESLPNGVVRKPLPPMALKLSRFMSMSRHYPAVRRTMPYIMPFCSRVIR